ncbi:DNA polymerase-1 [Rhodoblastus acidophilus]|nr:DNA polymerase-1 [Rhodoblastus acidophilus]
MVEMMDDIAQKLPNTVPYLCLTHPHNFRKDIDPTYKANRKAQRKPMAFSAFRKWVTETYTTITKPNLEADDVLGILATKPGNDAIIMSADKDLRQIPGKHWDGEKVIEVTKAEGDWWHMMQTLTGDPVDGYAGCPGIGKVKAERILKEAEEPSVGFWWPCVLDAYEKAQLTEEDALKQARLARILQWDDWDQERQEVKLWVPK